MYLRFKRSRYFELYLIGLLRYFELYLIALLLAVLLVTVFLKLFCVYCTTV